MGGALTLAFAAGALAQTDSSQAGMAQSSQMLSRTPPSSMAPPDPSAPLTTPQYVMAASQSDEFEMQEGRMAENQAKSVKLRKFGAKTTPRPPTRCMTRSSARAWRLLRPRRCVPTRCRWSPNCNR